MLPSDDPRTDELTALREEVGELRRRVAMLEAERDEFAQQNAELFVLQQVFSTMNSTLEIDDILATVLRGVHEALHFGRVVLFEVRDGIPSRRLETEPDGTVISSRDTEAMRHTAAFRSMVVGTSDFAFGMADDGDSPLPDVQGTYCMLPLISRNTVRGILYVDNPPDPDIGETVLRMLLDFAAQAAIAMENARLYSETKRLLEETQRLASTDPLTGLANRRALNELIERELHNAERYGAPLAFLVLDLDDLKKINDSQGHHAGDEALKAFADVIRSGARRGDIAARYAGDEFVLVMAQTDRIAAEAVLRRLYAALERADLQCSAGVALFPRHGADATSLFAAADRALYEAKLAGKNRFRFAPEPV
ncbi:MAG: GGDEF domain-containing protein [Candidatus Eremiobacteraeota bacterium]|nr:GGDEF domain-containing protein [Candidatus Eremiobacteraeota bacterium]